MIVHSTKTNQQNIIFSQKWNTWYNHNMAFYTTIKAARFVIKVVWILILPQQVK